MNPAYLNLFFILATLICNVTANVLLKLGALHTATAENATWLSQLNLKTVLGAAFFGFGFLFYLQVLQRTPLNVAQSIFSLQFISVILAASYIIGEPIGTFRWIGIVLTLCGVIIVAASTA
ncbi:MAG: hypothetical protein CMF25_05805 [Kangiellaceae bacterium]|jgi:drug/metabolite transporter (DMT)-like permease|nr:hypothetical protein [Kangiellaceae bacterium]|tara:strand:+ start:2000 stop:2362 length:363 start_codon:yes stop_codon:yes gene_type:complete